MKVIAHFTETSVQALTQLETLQQVVACKNIKHYMIFETKKSHSPKS